MKLKTAEKIVKYIPIYVALLVVLIITLAFLHFSGACNMERFLADDSTPGLALAIVLCGLFFFVVTAKQTVMNEKRKIK